VSIGCGHAATAAGQHVGKHEHDPKTRKHPGWKQGKDHTGHRHAGRYAPKQAEQNRDCQATQPHQPVAPPDHNVPRLKPGIGWADQPGLAVAVGGLPDRGGDALVAHHLHDEADRHHREQRQQDKR
jgi:hypothetical protein